MVERGMTFPVVVLAVLTANFITGLTIWGYLTVKRNEDSIPGKIGWLVAMGLILAVGLANRQ